MRRRAQTITFRSREPGDDAFLASVAERVFSDWSRDPARTLAAQIRSGARAEIALAGDDPVGFFILSSTELGRPYGPWAKPALAHLDAIAVIPEAQGRRLGGVLTRRAEELAREKGAVVMTLMTAIGNIRARRLFKKCGFLAVLQSEGSYANGDAAIEMFKLIAPSSNGRG